MKKTIVILLISLLISIVNAQEEPRKISIKIGKYQDFYRFVFVCENSAISKSINVNLSAEGTIKLFFPELFSFDFEGKTLEEDNTIKGIRVIIKNKTLLIKGIPIKEIKVLRLENPSRVVVDGYFLESVADEKPLKNTTVLIDPGHGGKDLGLNFNDTNEKTIVLNLGKDIASKLAKRGIKASLTRATDDDLSIESRIKIENKIKPALTLSLHLSNKENFTVYTSPIKKNISRQEASIVFLNEDRAVRILTKKINENFTEQAYSEKLPITLLKNTTSSSLLIELPKRTALGDSKYIERISEIFVKTIEELLKKQESGSNRNE